MVSDVTVSGAMYNANKTGQAGLKLAEDFSQFLTLLTTQLQNQDPMNPMDSSEFTSQLVQFSQVEQTINTNQKLDDLVSLQLGSVSSVALGYVGMDVMYRSADMNFDGETPVNIRYALSKNAVSSTLYVYDESGKQVYSEAAGREAGAHTHSWDGTMSGGGKAPPGTYNLRVDALDSDGRSIDVGTVVSGHVHGIESQDGIVYVLVGERAVPLGQIINARLPGQAYDDTPLIPIDEGEDNNNDNNNNNNEPGGAA